MLVKSAGICYKSGPLVVINRVGTQLVFGSTSVFGVRGSVVFASTRKENNTNVLKRKHMPSWNPNTVTLVLIEKDLLLEAKQRDGFQIPDL